MTVSIRAAEAGDVPAILDIYNDAVIHTTASYDYEPSTLEQRQAWFEQHQEAGLPVLVAMNSDGRIVGGDHSVSSGIRSGINTRWSTLSMLHPISAGRGSGG